MSNKSVHKKIAVIGSGVAGLASAVRLAHLGYQVDVYEQSETYGGKMGEMILDGYRFDTGPSLFTMPHYVDEVLALGNDKVDFSYKELDVLCHYFWNDGKGMKAYADTEKTALEFETRLGEPSSNIRKYLAKSKQIFGITDHVFLQKSLHRLATFLRWKTFVSALRLPQIQLLRSMAAANNSRFEKEKTKQFFNRYATYNGSNPYQAPATLNVIPHYEFGFGAFLPANGMRGIADALYQKAQQVGVSFKFGQTVEEVIKKGECYMVNAAAYDKVVCNMDVTAAARGPLKGLLNESISYEPSSSALIFYWGINKTVDELGVHNIFFSDDYKAEFDDIFKKKTIHTDPTVYINITSKGNSSDAPAGCENWFVMVNAPHEDHQDWDRLIIDAREAILQKLSFALKFEVSEHIVVEEVLEPRLIEKKTGSYKGALYGSSSNNRMAAFLRQSNTSKKHEGLYFCGGSVHPGGGIPLCLLSGKITSELIAKDDDLV